MAETKIWPIFRWANGGLSDDLFTGIRNSFYYSNDMEVREDAKSVYPKPIPAYIDRDSQVIIWTGASWESYVKNVTYSSEEGGWLVCTNKKIYLVDNNWATLLCTLSETICDLELFNWYIYISTSSKLYYKRDNWAYWTDLESATSDSDEDYGVMAIALTGNLQHPLYATHNILCVWDTNKMWKVTKTIPNLLQAWFDIQKEYYIRFINELWGYIRIIAVNEPYGSELLLWDWKWDSIDERIPLDWYSIIGSEVYNGYQYLLSQKWLGLMNWYQYYIIKKAEWDVEISSRGIYNNMCVYDDKLYFITKQWVYIYWAKNKNYADVLSLWHKVENWYSMWAIGSYKWGIMVTRNWRYYQWENEPILVWINTWLPDTWEIQTMCYFWTSMSEIKQSGYIRIGYHLGKEWNNSGDIHVYYRTEADATTDNPEDWQRHPVQINDTGLSASWDMRSPFATTLKLNCRFQWIQFKFVLKNCRYTSGGTKYTKDTNLYSADLYYNVMLD